MLFLYQRIFYLLNILILLLVMVPAKAQLRVTLTSNGVGVGLSNCNARDLTTTISGGSGNYQIFYGVVGSGSIKSENKTHIIIDPQPTETTTYSVAVFDNVTGGGSRATVTVPPIMINSFDGLFIPNAFTPNFDGVNDRWVVTNAAKDPLSANKSIGAYKYSLTIVDPGGTPYVNLENEVGANGWNSFVNTGLVSGMAYWDGFRQGTLQEAPVGTYYYSLKFFNCTYPAGKEFKGFIYLVR